MLYFAQVILYTAAMLLIYFLFLRNKPLYQFSRYYLLASILLPVVMPFVTMPQAIGRRIQQATSFQVNLPAFVVNTAGEADNYKTAIPAVWLVYGIVAALILGWYIWNVLRLWRVIAANRKEVYSTYTLITSSGYGPGSFGRYIIFPGSEMNEAILAHEQAHVRLHHTIDLALVNITQALFWPNFLLLWIRRELKNIHEFQADADVNTDINTYSQLLLSSVFNAHAIPVMHSFIIHPIKRRIMMLQKKGTASPVKAIALVSTSLALFFSVTVGIQSCNKKENNSSKQFSSLLSFHLDKAEPIDIQKHPDVMPKFKGGSDSMLAFLIREIKYPENAKAKKIEGKVVVKFIVMQDGSVALPSIIKSPDSSLSDAALNVIKKMPDWEPAHMDDGKRVNVEFYLPIVFKLQ